MALQCPVCGGKKYDMVQGAVTTNPPIAVFYNCSRCSVMFTDVSKFFTGGRPRPYASPPPPMSPMSSEK